MVYLARTVHAVLIAECEQPFTMQVTLNGQFLTEAGKRQDIAIDESRRSFFDYEPSENVQHDRLFGVWPGRPADHGFQLEDFQIFVFTFGVYQNGP